MSFHAAAKINSCRRPNLVGPSQSDYRSDKLSRSISVGTHRVRGPYLVPPDLLTHNDGSAFSKRQENGSQGWTRTIAFRVTTEHATLTLHGYKWLPAYDSHILRPELTALRLAICLAGNKVVGAAGSAPATLVCRTRIITI